MTDDARALDVHSGSSNGALHSSLRSEVRYPAEMNFPLPGLNDILAKNKRTSGYFADAVRHDLNLSDAQGHVSLNRAENF